LFIACNIYFHFKRNLKQNITGEKMENKPRVKLVGEDGNVFNLMGICKRALEKSGQADKAKEMINKITTEAKSYHEALAIMMDYCEVE
jgi:hypothetical protein